MRATYIYVSLLLFATACSSTKTVAENRNVLTDSDYAYVAQGADEQHCTERLTMSGGISVKCN